MKSIVNNSYFSDSREGKITAVLIVPSILVLIAVIVSLVFGLVANRVKLEMILLEIPFFIAVVVSILLFIRKKYRSSRKLLLLVFGAVSLFCFYNWGILHYFGILLGFLFVSISFFTFSPIGNTIAVLTYLIAFLLIGGAQSFGMIAYDYSWSPEVFIFDLTVVLFTFILLAYAVFLYRADSEYKLKTILDLNKDIKVANSNLQQKVLHQTVKLMKSRSEIDKSQEVLSKAYKRLSLSERDRFIQMNRLAHYALSVSKKVHNSKSPIMFVVNQLNNLNIPLTEKKKLLEQMQILNSEFETVQNSLRDSNNIFEFDINTILSQSIDILEWKFKKYNIEIPRVDNTKFLIKGDSKKFSQVILNLLDNAIGAVESRSNPVITVNVALKDHCAVINIVDNGEGFSESNKKFLFKSFFTTKKDGCGLGLYISKRYIKEFWNGDIRYKRKKNLTSFTITIPLYEPKKARD